MDEDVGVGGGVDAAVDVLVGADAHRREVAGDGARRGHRVATAARAASRAARTPPGGRRRGGRRRSRGRAGQPWPSSSSTRVRSGGRSGRRAAACWRRRWGAAPRAGARCAPAARATGGASRGGGRGPTGTGRSSSAPSMAAKNASPAGDSGAPADQAAMSDGRHAEPERGAGDRAGRGADDELGGARVPAHLPLEGREHAGVVRLADDATGAEDETGARRHGRSFYRSRACADGACSRERHARRGSSLSRRHQMPELLVSFRSIRHGLPDRATARPGAAHLEPLDRDRAGRAAVVAHADRAVALAALDPRLLPRAALGAAEAHPVARAQPDLEQRALGERRRGGLAAASRRVRGCGPGACACRPASGRSRRPCAGSR